MIVRRLELRDFRNYERAELELGPGLSVVAGPNGAGKTNLLEALYFALTARSCRTSNERELVRLGTKVTRVSAEVEAEDGMHSLEVGFAPGDEKRVRVDGAAPDGSPASVPRPLVSVFLPDRLELVKGAPALRRSHLDQFLVALWPARAALRSAYSRALSQRNAIVARVRAGAAPPSLLDTWDGELARHGIELMAAREEAVERLAAPFEQRAAELGLPEPASLRYQPRSRAGSAAELRAELLERRPSDLERGFTTHGPHRDELTLVHAARALRSYGSQGQQRVGLLALLFAERDALMDAGRPPLMLLDDVMSELDEARRERLAELVRAGGQAVITTTDPELVPGSGGGDVTLLRALDGHVTPDLTLKSSVSS
jgi:DNA replication and repair protein RecF